MMMAYKVMPVTASDLSSDNHLHHKKRNDAAYEVKLKKRPKQEVKKMDVYLKSDFEEVMFMTYEKLGYR